MNEVPSVLCGVTLPNESVLLAGLKLNEGGTEWTAQYEWHFEGDSSFWFTDGDFNAGRVLVYEDQGNVDLIELTGAQFWPAFRSRIGS